MSEEKKKSGIIVQNSVGQGEDMELLMLDLSTIARATSDFSTNNKIGEGGFGPVYRVNLQQEVMDMYFAIQNFAIILQMLIFREC